MKKQFLFYKPDYNDEKAKLQEFLVQFTDSSLELHPIHGKCKYMIELQKIADGKQKKLNILIEDIEEYLDEGLALSIKRNTMRYVDLFSECLDSIMPVAQQVREEEEDEKDEYQKFEEEMNKMLLNQRALNSEQNDINDPNNQRNRIHPLLKRKFEVSITRGDKGKKTITAIRNLNSDTIGSLVTVKAIVVRVSDVKPQISVACYCCEQCGCELYQTVAGKVFTPLNECQSKICKANKMKSRLQLETKMSLFKPFQEIKIQETSDQVPQGNVPKQFTAYVRGENCRQCSPGDIVELQGILLPAYEETFTGLRTLLMNTYIEVQQLTRIKKKYVEFMPSQDIINKIQSERMKQNSKQMYEKLSSSIAPQIFGLDNVKKSLLLQMVGGNLLQRDDGYKIRGDINIALIGDPAIAKSQLLKYIAQLTPRGIYTTGKGSSGVGLTASIFKDPITNEISLEGGALVLADMGICCIDEFDKMNEFDRTSIHEVMEQQTVSIAKAGITTSLNARTSILAAANPLYGRYNKKISPHQNINLPAALLSRFDLIFVLLDVADQERDELLARHIGVMHKDQKIPVQDYYDTEFIKNFIALAKQYEPKLLQEQHDFLIEKYVQKRQLQNDISQEGYSYTTPRQLLGCIRLAQALAKLRFSNEINQEDIDESLRLIEVSQENTKSEDEESMGYKTDNKDKDIFEIIVEQCRFAKDKKTKIVELQKRIINKGYTVNDLEKVVRDYENLNLLMKDTEFIYLIDKQSQQQQQQQQGQLA